MSLVTPGWRLVAIGLAHEAVTLRGHDLWTQQWLRRGDESITVAHPSYPAERHTMFVYRLEVDPTVVFAAGEFSNGVWGFFEPVVETSRHDHSPEAQTPDSRRWSGP
jgi:hypothetical protein